MSADGSSARASQQHFHTYDAVCPVCDQPIPNEKAAQVQDRIDARDQAAAEAVALRLREQFAAERVQIEANSRVSVEKAQREAAAAVEQIKNESATAIELIRSEVLQRETLAREEGTKAGQATAKQQVESLMKAHAESEAVATAKIEQLMQSADQERASAKDKLEQAAREKAEVVLAAQERVDAAQNAQKAAEAAALAAAASHEAKMNERLHEQREALEKDKAAALGARDSKHFEETQKMKEKLDEAVRRLEQKSAEELGEGAHIDLLEALKGEFEEDRIRRVPRGEPGADIIHEVIEDSVVCGKIVYDSKNRTSWRTEYATKLCNDKMAEGADHAILSLLKFPADSKQLDIREGVILANPARVVVVAQLLREAIVNTHQLRLSSEERQEKMGELYAYMTGPRFQQHLSSIEAQTDKLSELDVDEQKAHKKVWTTRGVLLKALEKAHGNLSTDVARIIGTREAKAE